MCVSVQDVYILRLDIDLGGVRILDQINRTGSSGKHKLTVREELSEHERMVGLGMVSRKTNVFVHIEGHDIPEAVRVDA